MLTMRQWEQRNHGHKLRTEAAWLEEIAKYAEWPEYTDDQRYELANTQEPSDEAKAVYRQRLEAARTRRLALKKLEPKPKRREL